MKRVYHNRKFKRLPKQKKEEDIFKLKNVDIIKKKEIKICKADTILDKIENIIANSSKKM